MSAAATADAASGFAAAATDLVQGLRGHLSSTLDLAAAEARLAAMAGATMLAFVLIGAAFAVVGWGFLVAAAGALAMQAGISWASIALGIGIVHVAGAAGLWLAAMKLSRHLTLPALREALAAGDGGNGVP